MRGAPPGRTPLPEDSPPARKIHKVPVVLLAPDHISPMPEREREYPQPPPPSKNNTKRTINKVSMSHPTHGSQSIYNGPNHGVEAPFPDC